MNRPIKFRAWDKENKRMVFWSHHHAIDMHDGRFVDHRDGSDWDVDLMQYTGLKDKAGREIYEGDILESWSRDTRLRGVMQWHPGKAMFGMEAIAEDGWPDHIVLSSKPEIIGNIYENPELLK